ncbi:glycerophosphoryl diester phosphodiesterase membrane domain-containing protein [Paenibacillus sp. N4]|uniref:glycerophosphoryl diester phosphodiesterase membrane domain-containing protein n=1 Tax=Paenibacillus vietnamensis TaxID=2590547 RepID=UPI001CD19269|nr:glycerophosphoryl diester phosphodiesterase membrane domain-containing protein [Paenibacillus vietnamensis]MCA0755116.1 glycerophosphoryl diester phosphodiesterase membrane domain-containing protein [Paenibacillus vietnamensis]
MIQLFWKSIQDFRATYKKHLLFEYLFMLLTSFAIIPILSFILNRIIRVVGTGSILNGEVYQIGLSYTGVLGIIAIGLVAVFVLFVEFGVVITIAQQHYFRKEVLIADAVWTTLRRTPKLFGFGVLELLFFLLFLVPFIDSPLSSWFFAFFNVPIFVNSRILDASYIKLAVYAVIFLIAVYLILRSIFVLHFILLEGKSVRHAVKSSLALTKGKRLKLFVYLFLLNAAVFALGFGVISSLSYLPSWLNINVLKAVTDHYSLTLSTVLTYMFTLLLVPVNIILLTRLYYAFGFKQGIRPVDRLQISRSPLLGPLEANLYAFLKARRRKRTIYISALMAYLALALFVSYAAGDRLVYVKWSVLVSAHRGDKEEAPENSLQAVQHAIDKGVDSVEVDAQLTKDGVVVLHHDYSLRRMAGVEKSVGELSYRELSRLSIGTVKNGENGEEETVRIPMLAEALAAAKGKAKLLIDLKPYGSGEELVLQVVRLVEQFGMERDVYIQSFDQQSLMQIRHLNPDIKIGQILYFVLGDTSALDVDFFTIEQVMLTESLVERAHRNGREVWVWTVNSDRNLKEVLKFEIDGIITDYPSRAQSMLELDL